MRIAYLLTDLGIPFFGRKGASVHARSITEAISQLGHDVVCYAAVAGDDPAQPSPVTIRVVTLDPTLEELVDAASRDGQASARPNLRRREIAGLCINDPFRRRVAEDHSHRPFDLLIERYSLWSLAGARLARDLSIPLLLEVNAPLPEEAQRFRSLALAAVAHAIRRQVFHEAAGIAAVSRELAEGAVREGADPGRIAVVPNGFDPALFHPGDPEAERRDGFVVGFLGSLKPWHGIETLCRAFAGLARDDSRVRLLILGDGPLRGRIERFARRFRLGDRIELAGGLPHDRVPALLRHFDVAVAPYADAEGFYFSPLKIFEYMGAGLPIVTSAIGQIAEVLEDGRTALLVPPGDAQALACAIRRLRDDEGLRRSLGGAASAAARERFCWRDTARKVIGLAQGILESRTVCHGA